MRLLPVEEVAPVKVTRMYAFAALSKPEATPRLVTTLAGVAPAAKLAWIPVIVAAELQVVPSVL